MRRTGDESVESYANRRESFVQYLVQSYGPGTLVWVRTGHKSHASKYWSTAQFYGTVVQCSPRLLTNYSVVYLGYRQERGTCRGGGEEEE